MIGVWRSIGEYRFKVHFLILALKNILYFYVYRIFYLRKRKRVNKKIFVNFNIIYHLING